jgi:hypothetical protein
VNPWDQDPEVAPWDSDPEVPAAAPSPEAAPAGPPPNRFLAAAEGMLNDISGGLQGVNPVAMQEAQPVAVMSDIPGMISRLDGTMAPASEFPADKFATMQRGGKTYIVPRTGTDSAGKSVEESRLASAGRLLGYGMATGVPGAARAAAPRPAAVQANAAQDVGVTPSFAMGGPARARVAAAGEQFFPTSGRFRGDAERVTSEIATAATKLADRAGPGSTAVAAGDALQRGGEAYVSGVRKFQSTLYDAVDKAIPPTTAMEAPETLAVLAREGEKLRKLPNTISTERLDALRAGTMTWEQARALRTDIGTALRSFDGSETNVAKGQLDQIYKALSTDLDAVVKQAGPEATQAWTRANTYKRVSEDRIGSAFGKVLGEKVTPEAAYSRLTAMTAEGSARADIEALKRVFQSLPKEDAAVVAGTIIRRLGRAENAEGQAFSAAKFLSGWNKMSPEARAIIGRSGMDDGVGEGITKLAKVIGRFQAADAVRNRSNTGNVATASAFGASLATAAATANPMAVALITGTGVLSHLSARALTNKTMLSVLNDYAATGNPVGLRALAASKSPLAVEAATILRLSGPTSQEPSLTAPDQVPER